MTASSPILFHAEEVDLPFDTESAESLTAWLISAIEKEGKKAGPINYIFCSDTFLIRINREYLNHDTYTDIITFDYSSPSEISGDIYISLERVTENAGLYQEPFLKELKRVMIHGVLHLIGYNDKEAEEQEKMRAREDFYLTLQP